MTVLKDLKGFFKVFIFLLLKKNLPVSRKPIGTLINYDIQQPYGSCWKNLSFLIIDVLVSIKNPIAQIRV